MPPNSPVSQRPVQPSRLRRLSGTAGGASAAIVSQGVVAASSLVLQWLALREFGPAGLGDFSILSNGIIVTATAIHTGWIGDTLVILDRQRPEIRRALFRISALSAVLSLLVGFVGAMAFTDLTPAAAALFGVAVTLWLIEETGRRIMMARFEFVALVINDVIFGVVSVGLVFAVMWSSRLTMTWIVGSLAAGSAASIFAAAVQLPSSEMRPAGPGPAAYREVAAFSTWRSGQLMMRPLGMLLARLAVSAIVSRSALGLMEAGRLIIAPVMTAANGLGGFSLPYFTRHRDQGDLRLGLVARFAALSAVVAAVYAPVAFLVAPFFEAQSNSGAIPGALLASWCVYAVAYAVNIPIVNALTALRHSRSVFWGRCIDSAVIVVLGAAVAAAWGIDLVPLTMTLGVAIGTAVPMMRLRASGQLPSGAPLPSADEPAVR